MRRTALNAKARREIAKLAEQHQLTRCEVKLNGCQGEAHAPMHRHKRRWYYDKPDELLWDINQWVSACTNCHHQAEFNEQLTISLFKQLRGDDYGV